MKALLLGAILLAAVFPGNAAEPFRANFVAGQIAYQHRDYVLEIEQLTVAADGGYVAAQTLLGHIFRDGHGGDENSEVEAEAYYLRAARRGNCAAQLSLARMYHLGSHESPDKDEALRWYEAAAGTVRAGRSFRWQASSTREPLSRETTSRRIFGSVSWPQGSRTSEIPQAPPCMRWRYDRSWLSAAE